MVYLFNHIKPCFNRTEANKNNKTNPAYRLVEVRRLPASLFIKVMENHILSPTSKNENHHEFTAFFNYQYLDLSSENFRYLVLINHYLEFSKVANLNTKLET